jgi:hypothetical protein
MNSIICLALTCLLIGLLYVYMRQLFSAQDRKIGDLTQLVASVATELQQGGVLPASPPSSTLPSSLPSSSVEVKRLPERVTVSDDSESEGDTDNESSESDSESESSETEQEPTEIKLENTIQVEEDISIVLDLCEDGTKTINLFETVDTTKIQNFDKLTVKELKELVAKVGGPGSLKTKKELIDFLEKKK